MAQYPMQSWELPEVPEGQTVDAGTVQLALLMDIRRLLLDINTELQRANAKADAVVEAGQQRRDKFRRKWFGG